MNPDLFRPNQSHEVRYPALALTPFHDGQFLSGHTDGAITLWNAASLKPLFTWQKAHANHVYALVGLSDDRFASGAWDDTVKIWDARTRQCLKTLSLKLNSVKALAYHPEGYLMMGFYDHAVVRYNLSTEEILIFGDPTTRHVGEITNLCILPNGAVISASCDGTLKCWDLHSGRCLNTLVVGSKAFAPTVLSESRLASGSWDDRIRIWDIPAILSGGKIQPIHTLIGHAYSVRSLAHVDEKLWASASRDNTIKIWNHDQIQQTLTGHSNWVNAVIHLSNGSLVSSSEDASLRVWSR
jgi:WD40 repeat protein